MAKPADRFVAVDAKRVGNRLQIIFDEAFRRDRAVVGRRESSQNRKIVVNRITSTIREERIEAVCPIRMNAFPRDVIEMRERLARHGPDVVEERPRRLGEVILNRSLVENIDAARFADSSGSKTQNLPRARRNVPFKSSVADKLVEANELVVPRRVGARQDDGAPTLVESDLLATRRNRGRDPNGVKRDVVIIRLVVGRGKRGGKLFRTVDVPFRPDEFIRSLVLHIPRAAQLSAAV